MEVAVEEPDKGKSGEGSGEGGEAEDQIDADGADGSDQQGGPATDPIGEQAVDQLARAVGERPDGEHVGDLGCGEVELGNHPWYGKAEVVAAHVVGGVEQADGDPVPCAALAEARGVIGAGEECFQSHPRHPTDGRSLGGT